MPNYENKTPKPDVNAHVSSEDYLTAMFPDDCLLCFIEACAILEIGDVLDLLAALSAMPVLVIEVIYAD